MAEATALLALLSPAAVASAAAHGHGGEHADPAAFGFIGPGAWVALAMAVLIGIMLLVKVPGMITGTLDKSIAEIRKQLDEARTLRAEAEALRQAYAGKIANAEQDAVAMLDHARHEADAIVAKAEADTTAVIARREKMAEDKIAASERAAMAEVRAAAAAAAATAARGLIRDRYSDDADRSQVDQAIAAL